MGRGRTGSKVTNMKKYRQFVTPMLGINRLKSEKESKKKIINVSNEFLEKLKKLDSSNVAKILTGN